MIVVIPEALKWKKALDKPVKPDDLHKSVMQIAIVWKMKVILKVPKHFANIMCPSNI